MSNQDGWNNDRSNFGGAFNRDGGAFSRQSDADQRRDEQARQGAYGRAEGRQFDARSDHDDAGRRRGIAPDAGASAYQMSDADPYGDGYARNGGSNRAGYGGYDEGRRQAYRPSADRWEGNAGYGYAGQGAYPPSPYASGSYDGSASDRAYADPAFARSGAALADWRSEGGFRSEETRRPEHRGRGPKDYKRSDERIREDVNDILTEDAHLDATGITVETKDAEVTLSGRVHNRHDKRHAEDLAERVSGVKHVQNNLRVHDSNYNAATATAGSAAPSAGPRQRVDVRNALDVELESGRSQREPPGRRRLPERLEPSRSRCQRRSAQSTQLRQAAKDCADGPLLPA